MSQFNFPTPIQSAPGSLQSLSQHLLSSDIKRPLIVTDSSLAQLKPYKALERLLKKSNIPSFTYSDFKGNPIKSHVEKGKLAFLKGSCDGIIAFGGGAPMDVAKAIAAVIHHHEDLFAYEDVEGAKTLDFEVPPIVAIPTTAGTGSEVGRSAVISEDETHRKRIIFSPKLLPQYVILDAELTLGLPSHITAFTGLDALTHLVEAFLAKGHQPMCSGIALEGIHLVSQNLFSAYKFAKANVGKNKEHIYARQMMLEASMMGAVAFQKGLGVNHSCAHALSTVCDTHHGLANGILLPYCMKFNAKGNTKAFKRMAQAAELKECNSKGFVDWLSKLKKKMDVPKNLREIGVKDSQLKDLVHYAWLDVCHPLNPRKVTQKDFESLFKKALNGKL